MDDNRTRIKEKPLYRSEQVALKIGVGNKTLLNWEKEKLVLPLRSGRSRIYTVRHLNICKKIKEFSDKGKTLKVIKSMLESEAGD
jgi:DNA-binding transcriptional MerR regulator